MPATRKRAPTAEERRVSLVKKLRRNVHVHTIHRVDFIEETNRERLTCKVCGCVIEQPVGGVDDMAPVMAKKLGRYRARGTITCECRRCTKKSRDERYPLPKKDSDD
jgi:hypothetical protein